MLSARSRWRRCFRRWTRPPVSPPRCSACASGPPQARWTPLGCGRRRCDPSRARSRTTARSSPSRCLATRSAPRRRRSRRSSARAARWSHSRCAAQGPARRRLARWATRSRATASPPSPSSTSRTTPWGTRPSGSPPGCARCAPGCSRSSSWCGAASGPRGWRWSCSPPARRRTCSSCGWEATRWAGAARRPSAPSSRRRPA
mmetsp:Transcript_17200/g.50966  ORF Transcript_17200/g.50966 Transcript_17200/m.50966 type:complete len:202 (-) Transcript_17200:2332-2937(-)